MAEYGYEDDVYGSCSCGELTMHDHEGGRLVSGSGVEAGDRGVDDGSGEVLPEVAALRSILGQLGAVVRDTDRWSGIEVGDRKVFLHASDRPYFDFLPTPPAASGPKEDDRG